VPYRRQGGLIRSAGRRGHRARPFCKLLPTSSPRTASSRPESRRYFEQIIFVRVAVAGNCMIVALELNETKRLVLLSGSTGVTSRVYIEEIAEKPYIRIDAHLNERLVEAFRIANMIARGRIVACAFATLSNMPSARRRTRERSHCCARFKAILPSWWSEAPANLTLGAGHQICRAPYLSACRKAGLNH
jgi:hypothetical protein